MPFWGNNNAFVEIFEGWEVFAAPRCIVLPTYNKAKTMQKTVT
jgi:hypothetical protein